MAMDRRAAIAAQPQARNAMEDRVSGCAVEIETVSAVRQTSPIEAAWSRASKSDRYG